MSIDNEIRKAAHSRWEAREQPVGDEWQDWFAAERRVDRRFYHNFPRAGRRSPDEIPSGLAVLDQIVRYGLLLTPETHVVEQIYENPKRQVTSFLVQQRFCLTELHPSEVPWHGHEFGRFSLEFDVEAARSIGAMPVLYFNRSEETEGGTWYLARMLSHLSYVRQQLLWKLIDLGKAVEQAGTDPDVQIPLSATVNITALQAASLLDYLGANGDFHAQQVEATIRLTSCLWSPTENLKYNSLMGYFKQREWRIVPGPERTGLQYQDLSDAQKAELNKLNPKFFGGRFEVEPKKEIPRVEACKRLLEVDGAHVLHKVRRIIAPRASINDVQKLIGPLQLSCRVVAIEDLW